MALSAMSPAKGSITDMKDVVALMQANISLNSAVVRNCSVKTCLSQKYIATEHSWGTNTMMLQKLWTPMQTVGLESNASLLLLGSDVVYDPLGYEPLIISVCSFLSGFQYAFIDGSYRAVSDVRDHSFTDAMFLLAHRHRHPEDHK